MDFSTYEETVVPAYNTSPSPGQLQSKLNLPRGRRRQVNQTATGHQVSSAVKYGPVVVRSREVGVIHDVEKLCSKLHVETL